MRLLLIQINYLFLKQLHFESVSCVKFVTEAKIHDESKNMFALYEGHTNYQESDIDTQQCRHMSMGVLLAGLLTIKITQFVNHTMQTTGVRKGVIMY